MNKKTSILFIGLCFWLVYFFSTFGGDALWGINFIRFLPPVLKYSLLALSLGYILGFYFYKPERPVSFTQWKWAKWLYLTLGFILFYSLGLVENVYGDADLFISKLGNHTSEFSSKYIYNLFSLDLSNPKLGNLTVLSFVRLISFTTKISHQLVFQLLGLGSGLLFLGICFNYIQRNIKSHQLKLALLIMVLLTPSNQLFLGHYEIYAPIFPASAWFFINLDKFIKGTNKGSFLVFIFSLLLCIKLHFTFVLLIPISLFAFGLHFKKAHFLKLISWKKVTLYLLFPFFILGVIAYFFVFKDYNDERFLGSTVDIYTRLFLPILSPEAPLDRYNLFSLNHVLDFVNMLFLWSSAGIFILVVIAAFYRKKIPWNEPKIVLTGIALILFVLVFFAFNPLLAMPMDFDLFSVASPVFLFFIIFCIQQLEVEEFAFNTSGIVIGLSLFSFAIYYGNHHKQSLSHRLESLGKHVFKTYWIRSAGDIQLGLNLVESNKDEYLNRYLGVQKELKPYAVYGKDPEYAHINWAIGKFYRTQIKDFQKALAFHLIAFEYDPNLKANYIGLMESNYYLENYQLAYSYGLKLIDMSYPSEKRAMEITIDCAIKAGLKKEAISHIQQYLLKWNEPNYIELELNLRQE